MKRLIFHLVIFAVLMFACNATPVPPTEPPVTPPPATEPPIMTNTTCNELSLYLDPALASSYTCEIVPESPYEMEMYPEHTELTLLGYPLAGKFFEPHIAVYPVAAYTALIPAYIPGVVAELQTLLAGGSVPPFVGSSSSALPFLPTFNAAQAFYAQAQLLPFASGTGVRFLTEYAQYYVPVNNTDLFYTYQGLTDDGVYWVTAILPVNHPILPADAVDPPGGVTWEQFSNDYEPYINDMVNQLNIQPPASYLPSITALDALVGSITITP
jgi:hypothetical protein